MSPKTIVAFDLYGTLLSTSSISSSLSIHFGSTNAESIANLWRRYQLEYTWRLNSMSISSSFSKVTNLSLQHALASHSVSLTPPQIEEVMKAYDSLSTFPDVEPGLEALSSDSNIEAYVFSNGTDDMVTSSVKHSSSLGPYARVFRELITVEETGVFKPDPKVYGFLLGKVGKAEEERGDVWLVSGNPFDVVGARAAGLQAVWVDREGDGWTDRLGEVACGGPTVIVKGVDEAVETIKKWTTEQSSN